MTSKLGAWIMLAMGMGFMPLNAWESQEGPFERFLLQYETY